MYERRGPGPDRGFSGPTKRDQEPSLIEHVLSKSLIRGAEDPVWLTNFFRLGAGDSEIASEIHRYIDLIRRPDDDLDEDERQRRDSISEFISQRFVNDIGNFVLLRDSDNISASNRPLVDKLPQYFNEPDDFRSIQPNRYFTPEAGPIDQERLEQLLSSYEAIDDGERDSINPELIEYFNSIWAYESLQERRVGLPMDILEMVGFEQRANEFGLD